MSLNIPQKYCFKHSPCNFTNMLRQKRPWRHLNKSLTQRAKVGLMGPGPFQCIWRWHPNGASLKDNVYMSSRIVCHKVSKWSAMATRNILMQLLKLLLHSDDHDFKLTQMANLWGLRGLRGLYCFCIFYEALEAYIYRNILMQLLKLLLHSDDHDFKLTQRANLWGLRGPYCFCIFYEALEAYIAFASFMKMYNQFRPIFTCVDHFCFCIF